MAINKIYQEEALLKDLPPDAVKHERLEKQKPKWDAFKEWYENGSLTVKLYQKYLQTASGLDFFCQFLCFNL